MAAQSKELACGHSHAVTASFNPAGGMDVCLLWELRVVAGGPITRPEESYRVCNMSLCVITCNSNPLHLHRLDGKRLGLERNEK